MTDWPVKTLGDLLEVSIGGIWGSEACEDEVDVFVYRSTELIKDGQLKEELTVRRSITARQLDSRKLEEGDLLLEKSGGGPKTPVGRVGLVKVLPGLSVCSNFMQLMRPQKKEVLPVYLHYFLNHFHVSGHTEDLQNNSTNIRNLKTTEYMKVEVPLPPLKEQKRIVALLEAVTARVTELTACYEQARKHANNFFTSALRDALESNPDWPVKTLGEICRIEMGRTPSRGDSKGWDKELKTSNHWASIADLTACRGRVLSSTKERISDFAAKTTKVVPTGTLVMSFKLSIGKLAFAGCDLYTNEAIAAFHLTKKSEVDSEFLYWALMVVDWASLTKGSEKVKGATMNKAKLNVLEIPVPPLEEQERIVALLDAMRVKTSEMVVAYDAKLTAAKNLRQSVLEAAFAGDL